MPQASWPLDWPANISPVSVQFFNRRAHGLQESLRTGKQQIQARSYDRTEATIQLATLSPVDGGVFSSWLRRLEGILGTFKFRPPNPLNKLTNNGTTLSATAAGSFDMQIGIPVGDPNSIEVGQFLSVQNTGKDPIIYTAVDVGTKNSNGHQNIVVSPQVREAIPINTRVNLVNPEGTFRLANNVPSWGLGPTLTTEPISIAIIEAI